MISIFQKISVHWVFELFDNLPVAVTVAAAAC